MTQPMNARVSLNALNSMCENLQPDHTTWAIIDGHMVIAHRLEVPSDRPIFSWWLDGKPIKPRDLAHFFHIDTTGY